MTIGFIFWLLMLIWFVFGAYRNWNAPAAPGWQPLAGDLLPFILFFLLGWKTFGWPIIG